jgi:NAD(P) transhydrogenase
MDYDLLVIGAGPAGQKAALQGAKAGRRVLLVDRSPNVGGECVSRGTIPSKTLRESALYLSGLRQRAVGMMEEELGPRTKVDSLMRRLEGVLSGHRRYMADQVRRNGVEFRQGRARFLSPQEVEITAPNGDRDVVTAEFSVVCTGSRPRQPQGIPIDHEHVLDSDSLLSMIYLPRSLTVLGAGVIAAEFASTFQALGVRVTMVDKGLWPLGFLDPELTERFVRHFEAAGGRFVPGGVAARVELDPVGTVVTTLESGEVLRAEKALVALGRTASVAGLGLEGVGVELTDRGFVAVDQDCRTNVPPIYAAGDVAGPPALAAASMEQGRRAVRHAFGLDLCEHWKTIPAGVYTIPEMATIGLTEETARQRHGSVLVGRARFEEVARGQINGDRDGLLKVVCDAEGRRILGAHVIGEHATELVHLAQLAMLGGLEVDAFVDNIFNFPTLAEAYRVAALDVAGQRLHLRATA